jgi:ATP-dependent Clp protease ATP-binding subunit ClpA
MNKINHTHESLIVLHLALEKATELNNKFASVEHLLFALMQNPSEKLINILTQSSINISNVVDISTSKMVEEKNSVEGSIEAHPLLKKAIDCAFDEVRLAGGQEIYDVHLFLGILRGNSEIQKQLNKLGFKLYNVRDVVNFIDNEIKEN